MHNVSKSYEGLAIVQTTDIPELVQECLDCNINLLIYGEAGCGKSTIIEGLKTDYAITMLSASSLCEEALNGIPVYDATTKTTPYAMPDWLKQVIETHHANPEQKQLIFIDEITLAKPEILNGLQILLTDRALPTHPEAKLPDNLVIVCATNTVAETTEGYELSRPLKTRFMTVRMVNTPDNYLNYVMSIIDDKLSDIKAVLGEDMTEQFIHDTINDMREYWCDNTEFYGTNPRTIMNFFKACNSVCKSKGKLTREDAITRAKRCTGHDLHTFHWSMGQSTPRVKASKNGLIPSIDEIKAMDYDSLDQLRSTIMSSTKATTGAGIKALLAIRTAQAEILKKLKLEHDGNKESNNE